MPGIASARPEPNPTVTTLSQPFRAHRRLPEANREEYDKQDPLPEPFTLIVATATEQKKEEDDPFGSAGTRQEDEPFRPAEEEPFQTGVERRRSCSASLPDCGDAEGLARGWLNRARFLV
jgi:hypothetical protein